MGGVRPILYTIYLLAYPVPSSAKQHLKALSLLRASCPIHRASDTFPFSETRRHEGIITLFIMWLATLSQRPP
jgi:hypothetical protein